MVRGFIRTFKLEAHQLVVQLIHTGFLLCFRHLPSGSGIEPCPSTALVILDEHEPWSQCKKVRNPAVVSLLGLLASSIGEDMRLRRVSAGGHGRRQQRLTRMAERGCSS